MNGWVGGGWTDGERISVWVDTGWMAGWVDREWGWISGWVDRWGPKGGGRWLGGWIGWEVDGWMGGWRKSGWVDKGDGWMHDERRGMREFWCCLSLSVCSGAYHSFDCKVGIIFPPCRFC